MSGSMSDPANAARSEQGRPLALVWAGMVLGISFLATPAKFLAPSLPLPVALDVGRQTFRIFGRVEVVLSALLGLDAVAARPARLLDLAPGMVVVFQRLWLRPRLQARTQQVAEGRVVPRSSWLHPAFMACEAIKLAALLALGVSRARVAPSDAAQTGKGDGYGERTVRRGEQRAHRSGRGPHALPPRPTDRRATRSASLDRR